MFKTCFWGHFRVFLGLFACKKAFTSQKEGFWEQGSGPSRRKSLRFERIACVFSACFACFGAPRGSGEGFSGVAWAVLGTAWAFTRIDLRKSTSKRARGCYHRSRIEVAKMQTFGAQLAQCCGPPRNGQVDTGSCPDLQNTSTGNHGSFAYSALACCRIGMSGSASFQIVRKS